MLQMAITDPIIKAISILYTVETSSAFNTKYYGCISITTKNKKGYKRCI